MTCVNVTRGVTQFLRLLKNTNTDLYLKRTMISITMCNVEQNTPTSNRIRAISHNWMGVRKYGRNKSGC
jgi:hypothetical protein